MFEGLVQNLLLGYLGSYIKNIQKEQLKIGPWNGEVKLHDLELNLEAFDNLQLPFSLKQGRVGTLSIKIPWKKLGWDPIEISLDNVFVCACQRDEHEWSSDSVERREYATKKAKLHAAEMAKPFISEAKTWQSFIPHITAKILDGIQVSITDVHFLYSCKQSDAVPFVFGLRLSSLKLERNTIRSYSAILKGVEVNKNMKISCLEIYCNSSQGTTGNLIDPQFFYTSKVETSGFNILEPCDVTVSLVVNRSGQLDGGVPQYSINVDLPTLSLRLNERQMHQILTLWDYHGTCHLREKYGRFRPRCSTLFSKPVGWQKMWWRYAQESVLSDIHKRLQKTSWRYLAWRITNRRKYVNLYKKKLIFIRQAQPVDKDVLGELEKMEKESDIDDILAYRSVAEQETQEYLGSVVGKSSCNVAAGGQQIEEGSLAGTRGWINWLSLGMLGAGGVDDSNQFSGVVSDEIVKDIYEVTQFHPIPSPEGCTLTKNGIFLFSIKFNIHRVNATLLSMSSDKETIKIIFDEANMVFKLWEESWNILTLINMVEVDDLCTGNVVLLPQRGLPVGKFLTLEVDMSLVNQEPRSLIKAVFEPFEVTYGSEFLLNLLDIFHVWECFQFHSKRVLSSLNGFESGSARLLSKIEYIFLNRTNVILDARFSTVVLKVPWRHENSDFFMAVELGSLHFKSSKEDKFVEVMSQDQHSLSSTTCGDMPLGVQLQDLYDNFEIVFSSFEVNVMLRDCRKAISIIDSCSASFTLILCIIPDESMLEQLKVHFCVSPLCVHFSPSIYGALVEMYTCLDIPQLKSEPAINGPKELSAFTFSINADLKCVSFHVDFAADAGHISDLILALGEVSILCAYEEYMECWFCVKTLELSTGETTAQILCSSRNLCKKDSVDQSDIDAGIDTSSGPCGMRSAEDDGCFILHFQGQRSVAVGCQEYDIYLNGLDLHIYPNIIGLVLGFFDHLSGYGTTPSYKESVNFSSPVDEMKSWFKERKFGFSNFLEGGSTTSEGILFDQFPFVTVHNSGSLGILEPSLIRGLPEQRQRINARNRKSINSLNLGFKRSLRMSSVRNLKPAPPIDLDYSVRDSYGADLQIIDLNLNGIEVYFHDTSCLLATVTLPVCNSFVVIEGARYLDVLCSVDGLVLSSSWATKDFGEFLWGCSVPDLPPVLNIRFSKKMDEISNQKFEISISVQQVCCVLPSEFLSILIGYFSMPAWSPCGYKKCVTAYERQRESDSNIIWNVEILDSRLILPVECSNDQSLHLEIQQLYFSFATVNCKEDALRDIPLDCMVPRQKVPDSIHLLNIFGRNSCLSLSLLNNEERISGKLDQDAYTGNLSLISSIDVDIWIRIPCDTVPFGELAASTCTMLKVNQCQVIAEDDIFLPGMESLVNVINDFSTVGRVSEGFKSDILQFLQLKNILRENNIVQSDAPCVVLQDVRCCVQSSSILLYRSRRRASISSELVAQVEMQFQVSASFRDEALLCLDVRFSSLALYSLRSCAILVQCTSDTANASVFSVQFVKSYRDLDKISLDLPSVHIWLHLSDWCNVVDLLDCYVKQFRQTSFMNQSPNDINREDSLGLTMRSENICVSLHCPMLTDEKTFIKPSEPESTRGIPWDCSSDILGEATMLKGRHCQYLTLILRCRDSDLAFSMGHVKFNCCVEDVRGMLDTVKDQQILSLPFFQLYQVNIIIIHDENQRHCVADVRVDSVDISASHQLFYVWYNLGCQIPETGSSEYSSIRIDLTVQLRKLSLLLTDWTCSCNGPILEFLLRNIKLHSDTIGSSMQVSLASDLLVNYFNIRKVVWEPFIETWNFLLNMNRTEKHNSLKASLVTDIHLTSTAQLNMNITEPAIEVGFRVNELIKRVQSLVGSSDLAERGSSFGSQTTENLYTRRYAPYTLQNETSLPLLFRVYQGITTQNELEIMSVEEGNTVYPGSSIPIYTDESPEEQVLRFRPPQSSDRLNEKTSLGVAHHLISIQLDGTCGPSMPISMDIVGLRYFEVNFSKSLEKESVQTSAEALNWKNKIEDKSEVDLNSGFIVPVVFDVSTLHYRKLIRVYSTVMLLNTTSTTLELQFDTPFGVSPKVLYQIASGQEFPLPLHLAEAGRMRWRPFNSRFLWSEAHAFSNVLSQETKLGSFRSFVCHPSHPSGDSYRCCLSIQLTTLASATGQIKSSSLFIKEVQRNSMGNSDQGLRGNSRVPAVHYVTLTTPLLVRNYMPKELSLTIESSGDTRTVLIPEMGCASVFHIDASHDLGFVFHMDGFSNSSSKFPSAEAFAAVARLHDNRFSQSETLTFYPNSSKGPIYVTVEKTMDAFCGARELCIFVPFLLYNCTGLQITVADLGHEIEGCTMPPCNHLIELDQHIIRKQSPIHLSSKHDLCSTVSNIDNIWNSSSRNQSISLKENPNLHSGRLSRRHSINTDPLTHLVGHSGKKELDSYGATSNKEKLKDTSVLSRGSENDEYKSIDNESRKVKACMYFPHSTSSASELMVRVRICLPKYFIDDTKCSLWSTPFYLVPASGSTCVVVPQENTTGAFIISVTSNPLSGPFSGRTRAITFQPRYVISNACSKDLCYKQKGADFVFHLGVGQHSHLHWADPTRELLVSLVFNEPGWLWSGSFFPDHLGDTQVKIRNYVHGALSMIRVEVQNADVTITEENVVGIPNGNSGTVLIRLSDDDSGFMPYRIANFSNETLRIYQEKCKTFETTVHSYMSCPYTWDEPCYPRRLVVEVLGERILGSYTLDDVTEQTPVYLPSTSEKPARELFLSVHSDGAVKVLSIMDSSYLAKDMNDPCFSVIKEKKRYDQKEEIFVDYCERISIHIPFIGVSVINSNPLELLFASATDTRIDLVQNVQQQKISFQISSLQVDNQLHNTAYPVILSLDHDYGGNIAGHTKNKDDSTKKRNEVVLDFSSEKSGQSQFFLSAVKWRNKEISFISFEYIILRLAALRFELEEEIILCLFDFIKKVIPPMQSGAFPCSDSTSNHVANGTDWFSKSVHAPRYASLNFHIGQSFPLGASNYLEYCQSNPALPSVLPIEDLCQQLYFLERKQNKICVDIFILTPIKLTLSFSSAPWMHRNKGPTSSEYPHPISGTAFQRGLMALADVEGAPVYLEQLTISHHMGTPESFNEILIRHYTPQLLHEMYKIFGSASVIGNPMGFAKNLGLGIKDLLSVPSTGLLKGPSGIFSGMAHGSSSLFYTTVYAMSNAATQFSKSVHKSIVAFTFDDQSLSTMERQWTNLASHSKGVLNEFLQGLTGFLQSPIRGAEKHGLPGFLSGVALGTAGVVARPVASILEVTGKTAQSIRNRSRLHRGSRRSRVRPPRPLSRDSALQPYSEEEAMGMLILSNTEDDKLKEERLVRCKRLVERGKFVIITERFVLVAAAAEGEYVSVVFEMSLRNVIYVGQEKEQINIVGINSETPLKKQHQRQMRWAPLAVFEIKTVELETEEEAKHVLQVLVSAVEQRKQQGYGVHVIRRRWN